MGDQETPNQSERVNRNGPSFRSTRGRCPAQCESDAHTCRVECDAHPCWEAGAGGCPAGSAPRGPGGHGRLEDSAARSVLPRGALRPGAETPTTCPSSRALLNGCFFILCFSTKSDDEILKARHVGDPLSSHSPLFLEKRPCQSRSGHKPHRGPDARRMPTVSRGSVRLSWGLPSTHLPEGGAQTEPRFG